ncbi:hypothetical protein [Acidaminobacterium chupaoyuni]
MDCGIFSEALVSVLAAVGAAAILREALRMFLIWRLKGRFTLCLLIDPEKLQGEKELWTAGWLKLLRKMEYPEAEWYVCEKTERLPEEGAKKR